MTETTQRPDRRQILTAAAWATPVVALSLPAPAMAASPRPGLQGIVTVRKTCDYYAGSVLTIDGRGTYPSKGLWVEGAKSGTTVTNASITLYFPTVLGTLSWRALNTGSNWSTPTVDSSAPAKQGMTAYTMRYTGTFTYSSANNIKYASGQPAFQVAISYGQCDSDLRLYSLRKVTVDGTLQTIERGPIYL